MWYNGGGFREDMDNLKSGIGVLRMPTSTLELPQEMVSAAKRYAAQEHCSVADLFADLMKRRYGFVLSISVSQSASEAPRRRNVKIPDSVKAISGLVTLPEGRSESDLICDAIMADGDA